MHNDVPRTRRAKPSDRRTPAAGSRWAVIVGVSTYQDDRLNLRFAAHDAQELAKLIQTPTGGAFPKENVRVLIDRFATSREVTKALRGFLTKPAPEDLVLIYLACHGGPDPRRPNGPLYLLTYDTEPGDIAGTAVPMDEIQSALRNSLLSERVVVIADTCHSGELGGAGRRGVTSAEVTNAYLSRLSESKTGVAILTSCEAAESSQEDERWGGGHGVFTWHLLEGMRGAADGFGRPRDGIVGVGELFEYVRERVRTDTNGDQHPSVGATAFDRDLPISATGDFDVQRHLAIARGLIELGWLTDDPAAFACAIWETQVADGLAALTGRWLPSSALMRAEALLATGQPALAAGTLGSEPSDDEEPETDLVRGVALAESGRVAEATTVLTRFAAEHPEHLEGPWAADFAAAIGKGAKGDRHALLIGASKIEAVPHASLPGARNDALALADHFVHRLGFPAANVTTLVDEHATRENVMNALHRLADVVGPDDTLVISYSGHGSVRTPGGHELLTYDAREDGSWNSFSEDELLDRLEQIQGGTRLLIVDLPVDLQDRISAQRDWVVLALDGGSWERTFDGTPYGTLTKALLDSWPDDPNVTCGELADRASQWMKDRDFDVSARVVGQRTSPATSPWFRGARLWRQARDRSCSDVTARQIATMASSLTRYGHSHWALARQDLGRNAPLAALRSLEEARRLFGTGVPLLEFDRVRALLAAGRTVDAERALSECAVLAELPPDIQAIATAALGDVDTHHARALIVGVNAYTHPDVTRPSGARTDAESLAKTLTRFGIVSAEDVVLLLDGDATRERIISEFQALAEHGAEALAVFHFAGAGSWTPDGDATILSVDARTGVDADQIADITIAELARISATSDNLVAIVDAGSPGIASPPPEAGGGGQSPAAGSRTTSSSDAAATRLRQTSAGDDSVIGAVTLLPTVPRRAKDRAIERPAAPSQPIRGRLTLGLERALAHSHNRQPQEPLTYADLVTLGQLQGRAAVAGAAAGEPILRHRSAHAAADAALRDLELRPVRSSVKLISTDIAETESRGENAPGAHLAAGLALAALAEHRAALPHLRTARNLTDNGSGSGSTMRPETTDLDRGECYAWASHHLGRILYEQGGDLNEAVAALRAANARRPDEPRTSFHLAQALDLLIKRESLREVEAHLRRYLELGAPLGQIDRVQTILASIQGT